VSEPASVGADAHASGSSLRRLLTERTPFIDLRAPAEFARGAVPGAVNLPLLDDDERHQVGLRYRQAGQAAAIALGHELVSGARKRARVEGWARFASGHPSAWLYCWRGGLRSEIAAEWLAEAGVELPRVPGGFKALRNECLDVLARAPAGSPGAKRWLVIGGRTGSGKTRLLAEIPASIDLEGLANHRGSAFGGFPEGQPTLVDFEDALAVGYLRHTGPLLVLEDESRTIGRLPLPPSWHEAMQRAELLLLETNLDERVRNIREEYVDAPLAGGVAPSALAARLTDSLSRIRRRLGGARHAELSTTLSRAFGDGSHERWIELLLTWYYDPMYDYELEQKRERISVRGDAGKLLRYIAAAGTGCQ